MCAVMNRMNNKKNILLILMSLILVGCDEVDTCLDRGGSYNYEKCECDFKNSHAYMKEHKC